MKKTNANIPRVAVIVGTRPEAIKMAPIVQMLRASADPYDVKVIATAQHRELLDSVLELFDIEPDVDLNIMKSGQNLFDVTQRALSGLKGAFETLKPDLVLVQGDTTTTFVGALAAFYLKIAVGHVEAGLRTYQRYSPFPEEINRQMTSSLAELHFPPTKMAAEALLKENVPDQRVFITGNTVIDALQIMGRREDHIQQLPSEVSNLDDKDIILMTAHRRESFGDPMKEVFEAIAQVASERPGCHIVYPVHPNPNVRKPAEEILGHLEGVTLLDPLDYEPFVHLLRQAKIVVTDSGGIQEEAPSLGIPVLVTREVTERPEAVDAGVVKLVGTDGPLLKRELSRLLDESDYYESMATGASPYGDGHASERIRDILSHRFYGKDLPKPFTF